MMIVAIVFVTVDMSRAVYFMTIDLAAFIIGANGICGTFKTGKQKAYNH